MVSLIFVISIISYLLAINYYVEHHQVPQQKNDYDCGLFVLFFIRRFIEDAPQRLKKKDLAKVHNFVLVKLFFISFFWRMVFFLD